MTSNSHEKREAQHRQLTRYQETILTDLDADHTILTLYREGGGGFVTVQN